MKLFTRFVAVFVVVFAMGCAQPSLYRWGSYESKLYQYYKDPGTRNDYLYTVREIIEDADERAIKPPPGLSLEYAIALYMAGYAQDARVYLEKERAVWPESAGIVGLMLERMEEMKFPPRPQQIDEGEMYWLPGGEKPGWRSKAKRRRREQR